MATLDVLYPEIVPEVMGCPSPMIDHAIRRAAAEFCEKSTAWREALPNITLTDGVAEYDLDLPADSRLVVIRDKEVRLNGNVLNPITNPADMNPTRTGIPSHYAQRSHSAIILWPTPNSADGAVLTIYATLAPSHSAATLPDILVDRYYEAIAEGAKAILKRMPNQPWSDAARAADHYQLFKTKTAEARIEWEFGIVAGSLTVKPRNFGGVPLKRNYLKEIV